MILKETKQPYISFIKVLHIYIGINLNVGISHFYQLEYKSGVMNINTRCVRNTQAS